MVDGSHERGWEGSGDCGIEESGLSKSSRGGLCNVNTRPK